jgi:hypothetical protein
MEETGGHGENHRPVASNATHRVGLEQNGPDHHLIENPHFLAMIWLEEKATITLSLYIASIYTIKLHS